MKDETIGLDGKVLRGSFVVENTNPNCQPHLAIMLVSVYLVERGLIFETHQVDRKSTETRYYISDLEESACNFARRIRGY